jgi:hypothetical protein
MYISAFYVLIKSLSAQSISANYINAYVKAISITKDKIKLNYFYISYKLWRAYVNKVETTYEHVITHKLFL